MANQYTTTTPVEDRFWAKVRKSNGCWEWTGAKGPNGYGYFSHRDKRIPTMRAARIAYFLTHGTIPEGLEIDHLCRNVACVNPSHLEAVTHRVNILRAAPYRKNRRFVHCKWGHSMADAYIRSDGNKVCRSCSIQKMQAWQKKHAEWTQIRCRAKENGFPPPTIEDYRAGKVSPDYARVR